MKKLIFILLITLFSCNNGKDTITISKQEYNSLTGSKPAKSFSINEYTYLVYMGSDGHEYYEMRIGMGGYSNGNRHFHYPDCSKCIRRDSL